ncbi:hypothetical protein MK489_21785 [Myxococcota bacterium]|nr:hypothetical protein [Myxococcota bacterium]
MSFPFAIFRAADAPLLDDTGMMDDPVFIDGAGGQVLSEGTYRDKASSAQRVTVPFRQEGEGGASLVVGDFAPGFTVWRHSHSLDCLYFILAGQANLGSQTLGPGDGFFVPADHPYGYTAGPEGVRVLEIRNGPKFDMQVLEQDMKRYVEKAESLLDAKGRTPA